MLSVQLSIIKLVFRNPCVVKARFCPLDKLAVEAGSLFSPEWPLLAGFLYFMYTDG